MKKHIPLLVVILVITGSCLLITGWILDDERFYAACVAPMMFGVAGYFVFEDEFKSNKDE